MGRKEEEQLWEAARDGKDGEIERLLDAGTNVNCVNLQINFLQLLRRVMGQSPAKATVEKKWAFSERKARESRNLYLLLGFGSVAATFAAAATTLGAAAPFFSWLEVPFLRD